MKLRISTEDMRARDRIPFWIDQVCAHLVEVECARVGDAEGFHGSVEKLDLHGMEIAQIRASAQTVRRTSALANSTEAETLLVNIQRHGSGSVRQDGRLTVLEPGDFAVYSSARPYELSFDREFGQTVLMMPATAVPAIWSDLDRVSAVKVPGSSDAAQILLSLVDSACRATEAIPPALSTSLADTIRHALHASVAPLASTAAQEAHLERYHLERIRGVVRARLGDPDLDAQAIAVAVNLSVSHVHRLFRRQPQTLMGFVWSTRLEACHRVLVGHHAEGRSIGQIAFLHGFNDFSHFSRAYRRRFGMSPSESRAAATQGRASLRNSPVTRVCA
jgi:AraC-like DNA-binding protein